MYNELLGTKFEAELFTTLRKRMESVRRARRRAYYSRAMRIFQQTLELRESGQKGTCAMQDETHMGSNPRGYAGGKWRQASSATEDAKTALGSASVTIKERARTVVEQQKKIGADQIGGVAHAIHGAADELEQELPHAAGFIHDAAAKLEGAADALRERSADDLIRSLNNFARSQPSAFFGGAVLAGFVLSRFLKSSSGHSGEPRQ